MFDENSTSPLKNYTTVNQADFMHGFSTKLGRLERNFEDHLLNYQAKFMDFEKRITWARRELNDKCSSDIVQDFRTKTDRRFSKTDNQMNEFKSQLSKLNVVL